MLSSVSKKQAYFFDYTQVVPGVQHLYVGAGCDRSRWSCPGDSDGADFRTTLSKGHEGDSGNHYGFVREEYEIVMQVLSNKQKQAQGTT
jgi:hypothetical protein